MKKKNMLSKQVLVLSMVSAFTMNAAVAQSSATANQSTTQAPELESKERAERPWWVYGSAAAGAGSVSGNEFGENPSGTGFAIGGLISHKIPTWVFDLGLGWMNTNVEGKTPTGRSLEIETKNAVAELSPRYRLTENWQLGPTALLMFGTDTGFAGRIGQDTSTFMLGGKLAYEIPSSMFHTRIFGQVTNSIGIDNRNALLALVGIQLGLPFPKASEPVKDEVVLVKSAPVAAPIKEEIVKVTLPGKAVYFATNSHKLDAHSAETLREIGALMAKYNANWETMGVTGHTDSRGSFDYNLKLSERRSGSVVAALTEGGAIGNKMNVEAKSYLDPVMPGNDPDSWSHNRRVDLVFRNVINGQELKAEIQKIVESRSINARIVDSVTTSKAKNVKAKKNVKKKK